MATYCRPFWIDVIGLLAFYSFTMSLVYNLIFNHVVIDPEMTVREAYDIIFRWELDMLYMGIKIFVLSVTMYIVYVAVRDWWRGRKEKNLTP